jgi:hypothetical protein
MVDKMIRDWQFPLPCGRPGPESMKDGVRVIGRNTASGALWMWYFPNRELAETFAKTTAGQTYSAYYIMEPISVIMPDSPKLSVFEYENKPKRKGKSNA